MQIETIKINSIMDLIKRYQNLEEATVPSKINSVLISEESDFVAGELQRHAHQINDVMFAGGIHEFLKGGVVHYRRNLEHRWCGRRATVPRKNNFILLLFYEESSK